MIGLDVFLLGGTGRVFKVHDKSDQSKEYALKVALGPQVIELIKERRFYRDIPHSHSVKFILPVNNRFVSNSHGGILFESVGETVSISSNSNRANVVKALSELHKIELYHGDPRYQNVVVLKENTFRFIDFNCSLFNPDDSKFKFNDMQMLIVSMFDITVEALLEIEEINTALNNYNSNYNEDSIDSLIQIIEKNLKARRIS